MKNFLEKRWHHIPVGVISAVLAICLLAGGVFAAYTVLNGEAEVTVTECFTVSNLGGDDGDLESSEWSVSMKPGESKILNVRVSNSSSVSLPITLSATESYTSIDVVWTPSSGTIAGESYYDFTLTVTASDDATPETYIVGLNIARG